jgi:hypothetical protein
MKTIIQLIIILVGFAALQSCSYDYYEPIPAEIPDVVSYSNDIQPIWDDRGCNAAGCHSTGGTSPNLTAGVSYDDIMGDGLVSTALPETSILYTKCAPGGSMYKYTQPGDSDFILAWIEQGAPNN